jgi:hypothetical protein
MMDYNYKKPQSPTKRYDAPRHSNMNTLHPAMRNNFVDKNPSYVKIGN